MPKAGFCKVERGIQIYNLLKQSGVQCVNKHKGGDFQVEHAGTVTEQKLFQAWDLF